MCVYQERGREGKRGREGEWCRCKIIFSLSILNVLVDLLCRLNKDIFDIISPNITELPLATCMYIHTNDKIQTLCICQSNRLTFSH